jgi:thioredoxin reductase (NADPH)
MSPSSHAIPTNGHGNPAAQPPVHEVAIIGAGPLGIELAATLKRAGVDHVLFEAGQIGQTIARWPRQTPFFSTSERLAICGVPIQNTHQDRITGEEYLAYLRGIVEQFDPVTRLYEPVVDITREQGHFLLSSKPITGGTAHTRCRRLVLASGDMAAPMRLGLPGEELPHVHHAFTDPHRYFRTRLLIVGGKNSAAEAALRCWRAGAQVTISYRREDFDQQRIKAHLRPDLETQIELGTIGFLPGTTPVGFEPGRALLDKVKEDPESGRWQSTGERVTHETDFVLLCTGYVADMRLFRMAGVSLHGENEVPSYDPETMETDVPGVYVCGTAAAGTQNRYRLFIENSHAHVGRIVREITGAWPDHLGTIAARNYEPPFAHIQAN